MFRLQRPDVLPVGRSRHRHRDPARSTACARSRTPIASARSAKPGVRTARSRAGICGAVSKTTPEVESEFGNAGRMQKLWTNAIAGACRAARRLRDAARAASRRTRKKWDVAADLGPTQKLAFDTSEGTWMNVDVSPDGRQIVFDLLGDIYMMPIGGSGIVAGDAHHQRAGLRHAAALQSRRQAHRVRERSRRPLEHLDDGRGREEREAGVARAALVHQQPGLVGRRQLHLRAPPLRRAAIARRRRDLDVPRRRVRRPAGHREERLPEGRRRAGGLARRPLPLLQQGRHARASSSNTTRIRTAPSTRSSAAI